MNVSSLFALTPEQKARYGVQPDHFKPTDRASVSEEYEVPDFIEKAGMRLWFNTQAETYRVHWHDAQEIIVPLEGRCAVTAQGADYLLEPGDFFLIPPGELHAMSDPEPGARFVFLIDLEPFCHQTGFLQVRSLLSQPIRISPSVCPEIYERIITLFMEIVSLYWGGSPSWHLSICARMLEIYACYADYRLAGAVPRAETPRENPDLGKKFDRLLEFLQNNYSKELSLEEAARRLGVSKYYFTRVFRSRMGQTFSEYLTYLRIRSAEELLKNRDVSVADVCAACGYDSVSSFNRNFRKLKGCSPTEFRQFYQKRYSL